MILPAVDLLAGFAYGYPRLADREGSRVDESDRLAAA